MEERERALPGYSIVAVDVDRDGKTDVIVSGGDVNNNGIPDILQRDDALGPHAKKLIERFTTQKTTVDREDLIDLIRDKFKERESFMRLPFTIIFFVSFMLFGTLHENISDSSMAQREMRNMLEGTTYEGSMQTSGHKVLDDLDGPTDFYNYMKEVVLPLFVQPSHRVLRYNQIIGGVLLQQIRRVDASCSEQYPDQGPFKDDGATGKYNPLLTGVICYPWDTESDECFGPNFGPGNTGGVIIEGFCPDGKINEAVGGRLLNDETDVLEHPDSLRRLDFVPGGGGTGGYSKGMLPPPPNRSYYSVYIFEYEGLPKALAKINDLEAYEWIGYNTAWVGVRMLTFNPELAVFVHSTINVYMPPGGSALPKVTAQSFILEPYQSKEIIAADSFYGLCVLWLLCNTCRAILRAARSKNLKAYFRNGWNVIDAITVFASMGVWALWVTVVLSLDTIKKEALEAREAELNGGQGTPSSAYPRLVAGLHTDVIALTEHLSTWRLVLCWYTLLISLKFLESFSAQPRLAVVTDSIILAGSDFFHFFIVMFTMFNSYVVAGMIIFGRRIWNWSNLELAYNETFLLLMGDLDYDELSSEYPLTAGLWFWTFVLLVMLLMLNMLMAIVMDVYTEVKGAASNVDPIWVQLYNIWSDYVGICFGRRLPLRTMLKNLEESTMDDIDVPILMKIMGPGVSKQEAEKMVEKTQQAVERKLNDGVSLNEALRMIGTVNTSVHSILEKMDDLVGQEEKDKEMMLLHQGKIEMETEEGVKMMLTEAETRIAKVETHITKVDTYLREAMGFSYGRGNDLASRLFRIEELLLAQRSVRVQKARRAH
mmetsp:Transcript_1727/g.2934  ORF Transcript_1727/g.2934 Transcript_1727/m.2934 type:complete len:825 (+) Transcript_1727:81-2555(+)